MHSVIQETACNLKIFNIKNKIHLYIYNLFVCVFILKQMPAMDRSSVVLLWGVLVSRELRAAGPAGVCTA